FHCVGFQATSRDDAIGNHLIEHSGITVGRRFEVDIPASLAGINILIRIVLFFSFVVFLSFRYIIEGGQVLITDKGAVDSIISGHKNQLLSVAWQTAGDGDALPAGSVITHYDTFIHTAAKYRGLSEGSSGEGVRLLWKPCRFFGLQRKYKASKDGVTANLEIIWLLQG